MDEGDGRFDLGGARVCAVMNAGSGRKRHDETRALLERRLAPACAGFEIRVARRGRDLPGLARQVAAEGFDLVVAVGGDGTQSAVADALAGGDAAMGVLPGGTFNYFARDLGVGETMDAGIDTLLEARAVPVDLGEVNGLHFVNNISFGAYPKILKTREGIYRRWGRSRIAAYWSVLVALRRLRRPMRLTTRVDGQERHLTSALVFVARSAYQLENFGLEGADAIRGGQMVVLIARASRAMPLFRSALRLALGQSARNEDFDMIVTDAIDIETPDRAQLVAHDGEKTRMTSPFRIRVRHGVLRVLCPAGGAA